MQREERLQATNAEAAPHRGPAAPAGGLDRPWVAYLVPYGAFLVLVQIADALPDWAATFTLLKIAVPLGLFLFFLARGAFPELRGFRARPAGLLADVAVGLGVAVLWAAPYLVPGGLAHPTNGFDADVFGSALRPAALGVRFVGFALVTPFIEELFVRSFLMRGAELVHVSRRGLEIDQDRDLRTLPIGRFTAWSFAVTVVYFTFSHLSWQWPVAATTGVIYNGWLYRRKHIGALVLTHAVTNGALFALVVFGSGHFATNLHFLL